MSCQDKDQLFDTYDSQFLGTTCTPGIWICGLHHQALGQDDSVPLEPSTWNTLPPNLSIPFNYTDYKYAFSYKSISTAIMTPFCISKDNPIIKYYSIPLSYKTNIYHGGTALMPKLTAIGYKWIHYHVTLSFSTIQPFKAAWTKMN